MEPFKHMFSVFLVLVIWNFSGLSWGQANVEDAKNTIQKSVDKARTIFDYQTRFAAFKDLIDSKCFIEKLTNEESIISQRLAHFHNKSIIFKPIPTTPQLSKREVWRLAGTRISDFCRGFPTHLILTIDLSESELQNNIPSVDVTGKSRQKRDDQRNLAGRIRSQTQSQYLNFGNGAGQPGKAEAESSYEGTKAVVTGTSGMGQAQSQSSPVDCGECLGGGLQDQSIYYRRRPQDREPEKILISGGYPTPETSKTGGGYHLIRPEEYQRPGENQAGERPGEHQPGQRPGEYQPGQKPGEYKPGQRPGEYQPGQRPGEYQPGLRPEEYHPGQRPAEYQPDQRPGEYQPGQRPGEYQPGQRPGEYQPGEKPGIYRPGQRPGEYQPGQRPGEYQPGLRPEEYHPGQRPAEYQPDQRPGEYQPGQRPAEYQPVQRPGEYQPGQRPAEYQPDQRPGEYQPGQRPGEYQPGQRPAEYQPDQRPGEYQPGQRQEKHQPGQRPGEYQPGQRPGEYQPGQRPEEYQPGQRPGEYQPGHKPIGIQPEQRPGEYQPDQRPGEYQPGQRPGEHQPSQRPGEYQPKQRPGEYRPEQRPGEYQPDQRPVEYQPGQRPGDYQPGQRPGEYQPGQIPGEYQPGQRPGEYQPGEYHPGQRPGEYQPGQRPGEYQPGQRPGEYQPGQIPGKYQPGQIPGEYQPGQRPGEYQPGQRPGEYQPGQIPGEYQPGQRPGEYQPGQRPGEYQPGQRPGEYQQGQRPGEYQPGQRPGEYQPGQIPGKYQPGQRPGEYQPGQTPREHQPGQMPGQYQPGQRPGEHQPGQRPGEYQPEQRPGEYQPGHIPGEYQPQQRPGEYQPGQRPGEYQPGQRPGVFPQGPLRPSGYVQSGKFGGKITGQYESHAGDQSGRFSGTFQGTYDANGREIIGPDGRITGGIGPESGIPITGPGTFQPTRPGGGPEYTISTQTGAPRPSSFPQTITSLGPATVDSTGSRQATPGTVPHPSPTSQPTAGYPYQPGTLAGPSSYTPGVPGPQIYRPTSPGGPALQPSVTGGYGPPGYGSETASGQQYRPGAGHTYYPGSPSQENVPGPTQVHGPGSRPYPPGTVIAPGQEYVPGVSGPVSPTQIYGPGGTSGAGAGPYPPGPGETISPGSIYVPGIGTGHISGAGAPGVPGQAFSPPGQGYGPEQAYIPVSAPGQTSGIGTGHIFGPSGTGAPGPPGQAYVSVSSGPLYAPGQSSGIETGQTYGPSGTGQPSGTFRPSDVGQASIPGGPTGTFTPPGQYVQTERGQGKFVDGQWVSEGGASSDDADSQVQTSVQQVQNETLAKAQAQGKYQGVSAQSSVSGTYSGSGSFSASAGSDDGKRGTQTQVSGGKDGASSAAQGRGGSGQSNAQVSLDSQTGLTSSQAQTNGIQHGTNIQVQGGSKGGIADAQANGLGPTLSQAQIGFTPYDENEKDDDTAPFSGGGTASAQSGNYAGMTQTEIKGKFRYGIKYQGAAQAASGTSAIKNLTHPTGFFHPINFTATRIDHIKQSQSQQASVSVPDTPTKRNSTIIPFEEETATGSQIANRQVNPVDHSDPVVPTSEYDEEDYGDFEEDSSSEAPPEPLQTVDAPARRNLELPRQSEPVHPKASIITQTRNTQKQHIVLDPLEDLDATVHQSDGDFPVDGMILQPGQVIPGSPGFQIPPGFRGKVKAIANGANTYAIGRNSQAQSVTLSPGNGRIFYSSPSRPVYGVVTKTLSRNGNYGSGFSYQPIQHPVSYKLKSGTVLPNFVSMSKSEAGSADLRTGKKIPNVYYTQSSSCGIFTNSCVYSNGEKKCFPVRRTNPDGTPMSC